MGACGSRLVVGPDKRLGAPARAWMYERPRMPVRHLYCVTDVATRVGRRRARLLVVSPMAGCILIHPVLLGPTHPLSAGDYPRRSCTVEPAGFRPVAQCLLTEFLFRGIPLVDDHLHGHSARPDAWSAALVIRLRGKTTMSACPVHFKCGRYAKPGRRCRRSDRCSRHQREPAHPVIGDALKMRVLDRETRSFDPIARLNSVPGLERLPDAHPERRLRTVDGSLDPQGISKIGVVTLIERA